MKKRKLKPVVKILSFCLILIVCALVSSLVLNSKVKKVSSLDSNFTYVNDYIFDNYYPVVNSAEKLIKPFTKESISVYKNFYDSEAEEEEQKNSIIYHEGIYMQNSGIDYTSEEEFDVVASLSGTVTNISDDPLLGISIEVKNSNDITVLYQSVKDAAINKGDTITQGQIIAKSGTCKLYSDNKNGLHFEIYKSGSVINPNKYFDKSIEELSDN